MRRCTQADKRAYRVSVALIISFAMLASGLYAGPAFAVENAAAEGDEAGVNTEFAQPDATLQAEDETGAADSGAAETEPIPDDEDALLQPDAVTEEPQAELSEAEKEQPSVKTMATGDGTQPLRVVLQTSANNRTLLQPDELGRYYFNSKISQLRGARSIKILISNPAECSIGYSDSGMAGNTGGEFLEAELTDHTVDDPAKLQLIKDAVNRAGEVMGELNEDAAEPEPAAPADSEDPTAEDPGTTEDPAGELQVTEVTVKINGTGQDNFTFTAGGSEEYAPVSGKIIIGQTRPTFVMSRTAKVRTKTGKPKTISRKYKEKTFRIIKDGDNDKVEYSYKTVKAAFEIKRASGLSESGYRANQGGCTDGTYSYHALCKKGSKTYAKIVKTRLSDMKVVKVSKNLKLNHANDITYDPVNRRLVVTHNAVKRKRVTFVNPNTLRSMGYKDIAIPSTLKGAKNSQLSAIKGFACVTYMTEGRYAGNYVSVISGNHNFLVLDKNFKPIEYITVNSKFNSSQVYYQGADNIGDKLYVAIYPKSKSRRDFIVGYDMDGNFLGKVNLIKGYETENIFHVGNTQYATLYKMVKKVWYTPKVVKKKVKLTKKERKQLKKSLQSKMAKKGKKGKKIKVPKYKTVVKIKKIKHSKKVKRSYIFRMDKVTL